MSSRIRWFALAATAGLMLWAAPAAWAQATAKPAPEEQTGLKVGAEAPRFILKDQEGNERALDALLKNGKVALVFFRSADW
jgi:cytochrome oxidase Cu insertion factor (SCO1/SenC/PrrC family)